MIVKKIKSKKQDRPKHWQIKDLVDYIRSPHHKFPQEKVAYAGGRNFITNTHSGQRAEMISLAEQTVRSKMPVTHWIFSWQENEQPSRQQVEELVDVFLEELGLVGHQVIYALHDNTSHCHLHIAVNRMSEKTGKVVLPHNGFDIDAAHKVVAIIENRQKWQSAPQPRYIMLENGHLVRKTYTPAPASYNGKIIHFEQRTGEKSAATIANERGLPIIRSASTWNELHEKLAEVGLRYEQKGSGAVVRVGDIIVKASTIDRSISMSKLCAKLGEFEPGKYDDMSPPSAEAVAGVDANGLSEEWKEFHAEIVRREAPPTQVWKAEMASLSAIQIKERREKLGRIKKFGLSILNIARHSLRMKHRQERKALQLSQKPSWQKGHRRPSFEEWLRLRGKTTQANLWRRRSKKPMQAANEGHNNAPMSPGATQSPEMEQFNSYAMAVDAERYRVTSIKMSRDGGRRGFVLDKQGGVSLGFTPEEMAKRMEEMVHLCKRGENIYYTPLSNDKHHILIDDMSLDSLTKLQLDGFKPAVILESSPGNYQCILTIPKLKSEHDREVGNRLTRELNEKYGDPKLSGCVHPHRAPGFENRKPKHQQPDGSFPKVILHHAEKRQCRKALDMSIAINKEYKALVEKQRPFRLKITPSMSGVSTSTTAAYYAHFEDLKAHLAVEDYSRVDAMIAVRLRATGHDKTSIAVALEQCAPTIREKPQGRNWHDYAERTANYAFGPAGDAVLHQNEKLVELWRRVEGQEEERPKAIRMR